MSTFEYRGLDQDGYSRRGLVEALDAKDAREKLSKTGILVERLGPAGSLRTRAGTTARGVVSAWYWSLFYRELAALLGAGLPLTRALGILIDSPEHEDARVMLAGVRDRVREGVSLADALAASGRAVGPFEKAVIQVGERSGTLVAVLDRLATFLEEQQQLRERVQSALIYPSIVFAFAVCVAIVMLGVVLPLWGRLLQEANVVLPALTRIMMRVGRIVLWAGPPGVALVAGLVVYARGRARRDPEFRRTVNRRLFHLPVFGTAYTILVNLRFARTLAILLRGGVSILEGLGLAGRATGSAWVEHRVGFEVESVRHGGSIADALRRVPPLSASLPGWIQTGEASGALDRMLDTAADRYQYQWNRFVARFLSLLEPALILFVGVIVLLVMLSILLPVLSLNRSIV